MDYLIKPITHVLEEINLTIKPMDKSQLGGN
jgi:hypothetical protein